MSKMKKQDNPATSYVTGIGTALMSCFALLALLSHLLLSETVGEGSIGIAISVILLLSSVIGNTLTAKVYGKQPLITSIVTTISLIVLMFFGSLVTDGVFEDAMLRVAPVVVGGMIAYVLCMKNSGKSTARKIRYR